MSFSINTNISAMIANLNANTNNANANSSINNMSSGSYFSSAAYDASGLGIANQLSAQASGLGQAIQNSNESIGMLQIADGAMSGINDNIQRIRTLTLQASNGTLNDNDRAIIQKEIDALLESSDDIAKSTSYNGVKLLDGTGGSSNDGTFTTQSGAYEGDSQSVTIADAQSASLIGSIDVTTQAGRDAAFVSIDNALESVNGIRADLGAAQNQLMSNVSNISVTQVNVTAAESQMRDVDFALESANFSKANIMSQIGSFAQAQANASRSNLVGLLG
jgi:flagellin